MTNKKLDAAVRALLEHGAVKKTLDSWYPDEVGKAVGVSAADAQDSLQRLMDVGVSYGYFLSGHWSWSLGALSRLPKAQVNSEPRSPELGETDLLTLRVLIGKRIRECEANYKKYEGRPHADERVAPSLRQWRRIAVALEAAASSGLPA